MIWKILNNRGFTLLEALISLSVLSLMMFTLLASVEIFNEADRKSHEDKGSEWLQFLHLMEEELTLYELVAVTPNQIRILDTEKNQTYQIILRNNKIYKTPGHHPYLYGVNHWQTALWEGGILVRVEFNSGLSYEGMVPIRND